jgi:orotidine-5'-phosphate decarboxylase
MNKQDLIANIKRKKSFLCVGLDPVKEKIPVHLRTHKDWIFEFNKQIINAVAEHCVAFKPNTAFYECYGSWGWEQLDKTVRYLRETHPDQFLIADAKRGDIGNTSTMYAKAFFEQMDFDAVTVAPYMGEDSVKPFLEFKDKWVILLALTSNKGAQDFQYHGTPTLHEKVIGTAKRWADEHSLMFVAGATRGEDLAAVRKAAGNHFLLVPGVGAQGGNLQEVWKYAGQKNEISLLVNSSRGIIYAGAGEDFAHEAKAEAKKIQEEMAELLSKA